MYNWQQKDWTQFTYDLSKIEGQLYSFAQNAGKLHGILKALPENVHHQTIINTLVTEAIKNSEIEGEFFDKEIIISSIKKNLGLPHDKIQTGNSKAQGIAKLTATVQKTFKEPLSEKTVRQWHQMIFPENNKISSGKWRTHTEPMQVIAGAMGKEKVYFEAPPSPRVPKEMKLFVRWFNETAPHATHEIKQPPVRAAIAHLYFESIHPFEDGNGRIGRAIAEKALSQSIGFPSLLSISGTMEKNKKEYYAALNKASFNNVITQWLIYFVNMLLSAQTETETQINFVLKKTTFYKQFGNKLNDRQKKVIYRMFDEGPKGFEGGMNATKYLRIAKTSKATATRDLQNLLEQKIFNIKGGGRSTHYFLNL